MSEKTKIILLFAAVAALGYITWHGHRLGKDCFLCQYRGLAFAIGTSGLGICTANG